MVSDDEHFHDHDYFTIILVASKPKNSNLIIEI